MKEISGSPSLFFKNAKELWEPVFFKKNIKESRIALLSFFKECETVSGTPSVFFLKNVKQSLRSLVSFCLRMLKNLGGL